jgi:hypothetical protein
MTQGWGLSPHLQIEIECSGCGYYVWWPKGQQGWDRLRRVASADDLLRKLKCRRCGAQASKVSVSRKPAVPHNGAAR